jgi:ankyrin repeat protein
MLAVDYGNVEAVQLLLDGNANVNAQEWGGETAEGPSAHSHSGRSDFIRGASDFIRRRRGFFAYIAKPLAIAILQESTREIDPHLIIIASILSGGADPNIQTVYGDTPLIVAVRHELEEAVELLVAAGADIHKKNPDGESAMDMIRRSSVCHRLEHIMRNLKNLKDISF